MILHRRRIDYKMLLYTTTGILLTLLITNRIPRELSILLFYFVALPLIIFFSIYKLTKLFY